MDNLYYSIVDSFWREDSKKNFSPCERMFFFYLLSAWGRSEHEHPFPCSSSMAERDLNMPRKTIVECRKKLQKRGLIDFQEGEKKAKNPYYFFTEVTLKVTKKVTLKVTKNVTLTDSVTKVSPIPPSKNNINNNKENSSNEELKKDKLSSPTTTERMDWGAFMQTFNEMLAPAIPKVMTMSEARRKKVKSIVRDFGKQAIMQAFEKIRQSDFLMGRNRKQNDTWQCCFDWIFTTSNFIKILEGNYDNGASNNQTNGPLRAKSGAVQEQPIDIYREVFGYDGPPDKFEEWFNKHPYGG
jgi:hypothetical protein